MIAKAIILSIDYTGNKCVIRIPIFEGVNNANKLTFAATFCIQPGVYNGYKVGDVVFVGFEDNEINSPVVLGKLYLGAAAEATSTGTSSIVCNNIVVSNSADLPINTNLGNNSVTSLTNAINTLKVKVNTNNNK